MQLILSFFLNSFIRGGDWRVVTEPAATGSFSFMLKNRKKKATAPRTQISRELQPHAWLREHSPSRSFHVEKKAPHL
jgi:hypothetical protein